MGDGRHRADPKGHGHYLAAALGVFLLVALLAGGGYTLHGALTNQPTPPPAALRTADGSPSPGASVHAAASPSGSRASRDDSSPTLEVRATGDNCYVKVATLPEGRILFADTLTPGQRWSTDKPELQVTLGNAEAAEVFVNGEAREGRGAGPETFDVSRED